MMNKIDTETLKAKHNIVDYIDKYVKLKKAGANYQACCPFHDEKSPSFTVNEAKQFYYCFGCGAKGNVIDFAMEYGRLDFIEACKMLGADIQLMSDDKIKANQNRIISHLPSYDKRDPTGVIEAMKSPDYDPQFTAKVNDLFTGELVNIYDIVTGKFFAGGVSHLAGTFLVCNESVNFIVCTDFSQACRLSSILNINFLVAYSPMNIKLICEAESNYKFMPLITPDDTHAHNLTSVKNWIYADNYKTSRIVKNKKG